MAFALFLRISATLLPPTWLQGFPSRQWTFSISSASSCCSSSPASRRSSCSACASPSVGPSWSAAAVAATSAFRSHQQWPAMTMTMSTPQSWNSHRLVPYAVKCPLLLLLELIAEGHLVWLNFFVWFSYPVKVFTSYFSLLANKCKKKKKRERKRNINYCRTDFAN